MSVEETLAQAKEKLAELKQERKEKEQELYAAWAHDAETAWEAGQAFYQPVIGAHSLGGSSVTQRGLHVEIALEAITAAGWRLHSWSVASIGTLVNAHPLFVRDR